MAHLTYVSGIYQDCTSAAGLPVSPHRPFAEQGESRERHSIGHDAGEGSDHFQALITSQTIQRMRGRVVVVKAHRQVESTGYHQLKHLGWVAATARGHRFARALQQPEIIFRLETR